MLPLEIRVLTDSELDAVADGASLDADASSMAHVDRDAAESAHLQRSEHPAVKGLGAAENLRVASGVWVH